MEGKCVLRAEHNQTAILPLQNDISFAFHSALGFGVATTVFVCEYRASVY